MIDLRCNIVALTLLAFWGVAAFRTAPRTFSRVMHVVEVVR